MNQQQEQLQQILTVLNQVILGKPKETRLALVCMLARGHLLIDDLPGVGKTTLAHTLAKLLGLDYSRIQFTSDMLPADIIGLSLYDREKNDFRFIPGAIFSNLVLADEINRATPKTQSALLEAMAEFQVTSEGNTRKLPQPFFVIATQNPSHQIGTFHLPESQLDRFMFRLELGYPDHQAEIELLASGGKNKAVKDLVAIVNPQDIIQIQAEVDKIHSAPPLLEYIRALLDETRRNAVFQHGLSPRAGLAILAAAKALAYLEHRDMVLPDDVQEVFPCIARHRLLSLQQRNMAKPEDISQILQAVNVY